MSSEELQQVELGKEIFLPMLDEVLERFGNLTFLNIEIKSPNAASEVARLLHEYELDLSPNQLIVSSFLEQPLMEIKKINLRIPTGLLYLSPWGKIKQAKRLGCTAVHPFVGRPSLPGLERIRQFFVHRNIRIAQKQKFQINAWTINSPRIIKELLRYKISGIITDNLDTALKLRENHFSN
jgi:glycerophosphoryl diester phosphodiesterase